MEEIITRASKNMNGKGKLATAVKKIDSEFSKGIKASHEIARQLEKIKNEELFKQAKSPSFSDFVESTWGMSRSQAGRLVQVAERFLHIECIDEKGKKHFMYENYSTSKLVEMLKATDGQLEKINEGMSVREIRKIIEGEKVEQIEDKEEKKKEKKKKVKFDLEGFRKTIEERANNTKIDNIEMMTYQKVLKYIEAYTIEE